MPYEFVSDDVFVNYTFHNILQKRPKKHFHQGKQTVQLDWLSLASPRKINLPKNRKGDFGFQDTNEQCSTSRI